MQEWREREEIDAEIADPELREELERERMEKYGDGPVVMGEDLALLVMVVVGGKEEDGGGGGGGGEVEFEVV